MDYIISGIQQVGIGVQNVYEAWAWYRRFFGVDVPIFDEEAVAGEVLRADLADRGFERCERGDVELRLAVVLSGVLLELLDTRAHGL